MATSESLSVSAAVRDGFSPSMVWNVANLSPLMAWCLSPQITEEQTRTFTKLLRLEDTAKESPREQFEWELMSVAAWDGKLQMLLLDGTPLPESWSRKFLHRSERSRQHTEKDIHRSLLWSLLDHSGPWFKLSRSNIYSALRNEDVLVVYPVTIKSITFNQIVVSCWLSDSSNSANY